MTETLTIRNGIDVDQLLTTIEAIKDDPAVGTSTFRASSRWEEGTYNLGEIGRFIHAGQEDQTRGEAFQLEGDEPPVLLGRNRGLERGGAATAGARILLRRRVRGQCSGAGNRAHRDGVRARR